MNGRDRRITFGRMESQAVSRATVWCAVMFMTSGGVAACTNDSAVTSLVSAAATSITFDSAAPISVPTQRDVYFVVDVRDAQRNPLFKSTVEWTTSNPSVLQLDQRIQGVRVRFQSLAAGTAVVTATVGALHASRAVTVHPPGPVAGLIISDVPAQSLGTTYQLQWAARDADETMLPLVLPRFESSDTAVLRVSTAGVITTYAEGTATITAVVQDKFAQQGVTVLAGERAFLWTESAGMTDLGVPQGFVTSRAHAISASGLVVGSAGSIGARERRAVSWTANALGGLRVLPTLVLGGRSEAFAVNISGDIAGYATIGDGRRHATIWSADGDIQDLGTLPGGSESVALGMNDAGHVVGWSTSALGSQAFVWTRADGMRVVGNSLQSVATAISRSGTIVGMADSLPFTTNAIGPLRLPTPAIAAKGIAMSVNDSGESVGVVSQCLYLPAYDECDASGAALLTAGVFWAGTSAIEVHALRWLSSDSWAITGGDFSNATCINNQRQVGGTNVAGVAVIATTNSSAVEAARTIGTLARRSYSSPSAINSVGQVVGWSGNRREYGWSGNWLVARSSSP